MIEITDGAKKKIKKILDENPGKHLRIEVEGDGCAGPYLSLFPDEASSNEKVIEIDGIKLLLSEDVKRHSEITTIRIYVNQVGGDLIQDQKL
jgi:Fe-S cluster assembly iron-binding protein IscA